VVITAVGPTRPSLRTWDLLPSLKQGPNCLSFKVEIDDRGERVLRVEISVWLQGVTTLLFGRIAKTDLRSVGCSGLSSYTCELC
jgi:hypothetical protein